MDHIGTKTALAPQFLGFLIFQLQKPVLRRQLVEVAARQAFGHARDFGVDDGQSLDQLFYCLAAGNCCPTSTCTSQFIRHST